LSRHLSRVLFGLGRHPLAVEIPGALDHDSRLRLVAEGRGLATIAVPATSELPPTREGVVYRRLEDPPALVEFGLVWLDTNASPTTLGFVDIARELRDVAA